MFTVTHRKIFYTLSGILLTLSFVAIFVFGLRFGIDFKGGSLIEVTYHNGRPDVAALKSNLDQISLSEYSIRPTGEQGFIVRTHFLNEQSHEVVLSALSGNGSLEIHEERFDSIGPSIGKELQTKAFVSVGLVLLAIVIFIAFTFRKVSEPVASWKYGLVAIIALLHDVIVPIGFFAVLGAYTGAEIDTLFVTALLVILGFSVHDTIVVFDRVRENLRRNKESHIRESFEETVGKSVSQTLARSINTSLTTLLTLAALYIAGPEIIKNFSLALLVGIAVGTYSSIFIGSPLLVTLERLQKK